MLFLLIKPNKSFLYSYPEDGCKGRNMFIYNKMIGEEKTSILFLGSSHTMNAIDDSLISEYLKINTLNIGLCGLGKNKEYMILKDWTTYHKNKPDIVVIECNHWENTYSYSNFGYMADSKDVLQGFFVFNRNMHEDIINAIKVRIAYLLEKNKYTSVSNEKYGYLENPMQLDLAIAQEKKLARTKKWELEKKNILSSIEFSYPNFYIKQISKLCKDNNIQIYFIYLPAYGYPTKSPLHIEFLQQYGKVLITPTAIDEDIKYWADDEHHNRLGAEKISKEIALLLKDNF
jgi:hypothetical protein